MAHWRFWERVGLTVAGVGIAYLFGLVLPGLSAWRRIVGTDDHRNASARVPTKA